MTPDSLLSLERFSIGGLDTVRGYRQNQLVSDNGVLGAVEFRIPLTENPQTLQINPFFEMGLGWNNRSENPDPQFIAGLGLGVQWEVIEDLNARVDYGIPLVAVEDRGDTLQERPKNRNKSENSIQFLLRYSISGIVPNSVVWES